jgi:hypothetical protein
MIECVTGSSPSPVVLFAQVGEDPWAFDHEEEA